MHLITPFILTLVLILLIRIYLIVRPDDIAEGDLVIVNHPDDKENEKNMITEVISVLSSTTVQIRGPGTTITMNRKWVKKIPIRKDSSIKIPEEPIRKKDSWGNGAGFKEIPLEWFSYNHPPQIPA